MKSREEKMPRGIIKRYASAQVKALIDKSESIKDLGHNLTKGTLRELFVTDLLSPFLSSQFSIGSGIIINQKGDQSHQNDLIIVYNHILPPFIIEQNVGVYPAECVAATIEIKSNLTKDELEKAEEDAAFLIETIYKADGTVTPTVIEYPLCAVFGFYGTGAKELSKEVTGREWLTEKQRRLKAICLVNRFSWLHLETGWTFRKGDRETNEETKRFLAVIIDNIRFKAQRMESNLGMGVKEWLSVYIRDQYP